MAALNSLEAPAMVKSMLYNGCIACLLKGTYQQTLIAAIQHVYRNEEFVEPSLKEHLLQNMFKAQKTATNPYELTKRESEILQLIVRGDTIQEIAGKRSISPRTAETHRLTLLKNYMPRTRPSWWASRCAWAWPVSLGDLAGAGSGRL